MSYINVNGKVFKVADSYDICHHIETNKLPTIYSSLESALVQGSLDNQLRNMRTNIITPYFPKYPLINHNDVKKENEEKEETNNNNEGCFITTACVNALNLKDDCIVLNLLRTFRDNYMKTTIKGYQEVSEYYRIAPQIVESINKRNNSREIYNYIFVMMILPAVKYVKYNQFSEAHDLYKKGVLKLRTCFLNY